MFRKAFLPLALVAGSTLFVFSNTASAVTITVNSTQDPPDATADPNPGDGTCGTAAPNSCSLRAAIREANANASLTNTIDLSALSTSSANNTITLTSSLPLITKPVAINGPSALLTIDGNSGTSPTPNAGLRFTGNGGAYSVSNLIIKNTKTADSLGGAALYFAPTGVSQLNLTKITFTGNNATAGPGGALVVDLSTNGSSFKGDFLTIGGSTAANGNKTSGAFNGGGVSVRAVGATTTMWIDHSQIFGNTSGASGGGITVKRGQLQVSNTTINGNQTAASGLGGGIYLDTESTNNGSVRLENVTISGNTADQGGGIGVSAVNTGASWVTFTTITANTAVTGNKGGGIMSSAPNTNFPGNLSTPFTSNLIAANTGGNCGGAFSHNDTANSGFNVTDDASCGFTQSTDQTVTTANLKIGGLVSTPSSPVAALPTHALLAGSPAIDHGNTGWMNTTTAEDERGADAQDGNLDASASDPVRDVGAYEFGGFGLIQFSASNYNVNEDNGPAHVLINRYGIGSAATTAPAFRYQTTAGTATQGACSGSGTANNDYTAVAGAITANPMAFTFTASGATQFSIPADMTICNSLSESPEPASETFNIALLPPTGNEPVGYDFGPIQTGTVTILDAENGVFTLTTPGAAGPTQYSTLEGDTGTTLVPVTITRTGGTKGVVRVTYSTINASCQPSTECANGTTATAGTDYTTVAGGTIDLADGEASKVVNISVLTDTAFEPNETFQVRLDSVACQGLASGQTCDARLNGNATDVSKFATITITNDDAAKPGKLQYEFSTYTINESQSTLTVNVKRVGGSDGAVTVTYGASDGSAVSPTDYVLPPDPTNNHKLSWANGDAADKTASFTIINDNAKESNKTFSATLTLPTGCPDAAAPTNCATVGPTAPAVVTIVSADQPAIQFSSTTTPATGSVKEGAGSITLTVTAEAFTGPSVTVPFYTTDGTAISPADYAGVPQGSPTTLTFNGTNAAQSQTVTINIVSDSLAEGNETFTGVLGTPVGGAVLGAKTPDLVTIVDPSAFRFKATNFASTTEANGGTITFSVERIGDSTGMATVNFDIAQACANPASATPGCAEEGVDYTRAGGFSGSLTWVGTDNDNTETATKTFSVTVIGDAVVEGDETMNATLSNPGGAASPVLGSPKTATGTITDDDYQFKIVDVSPIATSEGAGNAVITVQRVGSTVGAASVKYATSDGTATAGSDYTATATPLPSLSWSAGQGGTKTISVPIADDTVDEADETFTVALSSPSANANGEPTSISGGPATVSITDNDSPPTVTLSLTGSPLAENAGTATVTATLSAASGQDVTVNLAYSGTATVTSDYTRSGASISIPAGATTGSVTLTGVNDSLDEADETVIVDISSVTNGTESGTQQVTATITDDDAPPTVTLSLTGSPFAENAGKSTVTATLSAASGKDVTVNLAYSGTATVASDYTRSGTSITILAGATTGTVTLTGVNDTLDEANETVVVDISSVTNGTESGTQQVTAAIADDDPSPTVTLSLTGSPFAENGGKATVTATLSAASGQAVTVNLAYSGTATVGSDYTPSGTSIIIPAGATSGSATLTGVNDSLSETSETVVADISSVTNGTESGTQQVTATITDDDAVVLHTGDNAPGVVVTPNGSVATAGGGGSFSWGGLLGLIGLGALRRRNYRTIARALAALALLPGLALAATPLAAPKAASAPAQAPAATGAISYSGIDVRYVSAKAKDPGTTATGFALGYTHTVGNALFMGVGYAKIGTGDFTVQGRTGNSETTTLSTTLGLHRPLSPTLDFSGAVDYMLAKAEASGGFKGSNANKGWGLEAGLRGRSSPAFEWGVGLNYVSIFGTSDTSLSARGLYHFSGSPFGVVGGVGLGNQGNSLNLGVRYEL